MAEERFHLTRDGYNLLKRELEVLERRYQEQAANFADVNYNIDISKEEAAYFETRVMKEHTGERIEHLKYILQRAEVVDEDPDPLRVNPGERVTVWDFDTNEARQFDLIGSPEAVYGREGVSIESPVGKALLNRKIGDVVEVEVPDGRVRYAIRSIEQIPQQG